MIDESDRFEEAGRAKVRDLESRMGQMDQVRCEDREKELRKQALWDREIESNRLQRHQHFDEEQRKLAQERMVSHTCHLLVPNPSWNKPFHKLRICQRSLKIIVISGAEIVQKN